MAKGGPRVVELTIPSELNYEKIAMSSASSVAKQMGFSDERIEDVKTALSEACINAIEHGTKDKDAKVMINFTLEEDRLKIDVKDKGKGFDVDNVEQPQIEKKLQKQQKSRGWGLFLIKELVDDVEIENVPGAGNQVTMIINLKR
jgi:serine/threonine-protein kinase RsbW